MSQPTVSLAPSDDKPFASLPTLFWIFFQIGLMSFGGGLSAWVHREIVLKRGWMSEPEFFTGLALCQVLPGVNVVNLAVHVGQRLRGVVGAAVCTVGILLAPFFIVIALATVYDQIKHIAWLHAFFEGVAVSAVGLMVSVALRSVRGTFHGIVPYVIALTLIVTVGVLRWPMIPLALTLGPLSVLAAWWIQRRAARGRDA